MKSLKVVHHPGNDGTKFSDVQTELENRISGPNPGNPTGTSTDRALARWDGTTGRALKDSPVICSDAGLLTGIAAIRFVAGAQDGCATDINAGNQFALLAFNTNTAAFKAFVTFTANNPPTCDLDPAVTMGGVGMATLNTNTWVQQQGFARASLTDASPITWNLQTQQSAYVLLTSGVGATRQLQNPTNMVSGFTYVLVVQQSSTGSNALTYGGNYKWPGGVAPTLSTANNAIDILTFVSDGSAMYGVIQHAFA